MNNRLADINLGEIVKVALEGQHAPLALAIGGILTAFTIYMSYTLGETIDIQEVEKEVI